MILVVVEIYGCIWKWCIYPSIIIHHHPSFLRQTHGDVPNKREVRCTKLWPPAGWTCPCASPVPRCPWSVTAETNGQRARSGGQRAQAEFATCAVRHMAPVVTRVYVYQWSKHGLSRLIPPPKKKNNLRYLKSKSTSKSNLVYLSMSLWRDIYIYIYTPALRFAFMNLMTYIMWHMCLHLRYTNCLAMCDSMCCALISIHLWCMPAYASHLGPQVATSFVSWRYCFYVLIGRSPMPFPSSLISWPW